MENERRSLLRWPVNWNARIQVKYQNSKKNINCCIKDINFKGIQVILEKKLPGIEVLKLHVILPDSEPIPLKVKVIKHEIMPDGLNLYSLQAIEMKDSDKELLYRLLNKNYFKELSSLWWKDVK